MTIVGLQRVGMLDAYQVAISIVLAGKDHLTIKRGIDGIVGLCLEVDTRMHPSPTLAVGTDDFCTGQGKKRMF